MPAVSFFFFLMIRRPPRSTPLSLHDALPISSAYFAPTVRYGSLPGLRAAALSQPASRSEEHTYELQSRLHLVCRLLLEKKKLQLLRKIGVIHNRRNASSRLLQLIIQHLILSI